MSSPPPQSHESCVDVVALPGCSQGEICSGLGSSTFDVSAELEPLSRSFTPHQSQGINVRKARTDSRKLANWTRPTATRSPERTLPHAAAGSVMPPVDAGIGQGTISNCEVDVGSHAEAVLDGDRSAGNFTVTPEQVVGESAAQSRKEENAISAADWLDVTCAMLNDVERGSGLG